MIEFYRPIITDAVKKAVANALDETTLGPGRKCREFEDAICELHNVNHCILTTSGTIALSVLAKAIGFDEITVPAYGVAATANAFASVGVSVRASDVGRVEQCVENYPVDGWICLVWPSGISPSYEWTGCSYIEDAACAFGAPELGGFTQVTKAATFSFSVPKIVTTGQGGAIVTNDESLAEECWAWIDHGGQNWRQTNAHHAIGTNLRMTDIQAAMGLAQLPDLPALLQKREDIHGRLKERLPLWSPSDRAPMHNVVFVKGFDVAGCNSRGRRGDLIYSLKCAGVGALQQYNTITRHPAYRHVPGHFPGADYWSDHAVYLPYGPHLNMDDADRIADAVLASGVELEAV